MTELYIKIGLLAVGVLAILSNFVNVSSIVSRLVFSKKKQPVIVNADDESTEKDFLEIVSLWYQLKHKCDQFKLEVASNKLDEVFPLLNGVLEDEKTT